MVRLVLKTQAADRIAGDVQQTPGRRAFQHGGVVCHTHFNVFGVGIVSMEIHRLTDFSAIELEDECRQPALLVPDLEGEGLVQVNVGICHGRRALIIAGLAEGEVIAIPAGLIHYLG